MRKLSSKLLAGILVTLSISTPVSAAENTISFEKEAGTTPDSMLYPVDKLIDEVSLKLKSNEEEKVEALTEIAQERLGESEVMAEEGKQDLAQQALKEYEENMNEAVKVIDTIVQEAKKVDDEDALVDKTTELTDEDVAAIDQENNQIEELKGQLTEQQEKSIEVLEQLQDTVSDDAKIKLEQVIQMQMAKKEAVANFVEKRHEFNEQKKALNMAKVQLKKASKTGDEEAIKKAEEEYQLKLNAYNVARENMIQAKAQHKDVVKEYSAKENVNADENQAEENVNTDENQAEEQDREQQEVKKEEVKQQQEVKKEEVKQQQTQDKNNSKNN